MIDADSPVSAAADLVLVALSAPRRSCDTGRAAVGLAFLFFGWANRDERFLISFKIKTVLMRRRSAQSPGRHILVNDSIEPVSALELGGNIYIYIVDVLYWFTPLLLTCCPFRCTSR
jgi:hypothetical protein